MAQLVDELTVRGELDAAALEWARSHQAVHGGTLDSALLELDLIDEDALLSSLESYYELPAGRPADATGADPDAAKRVPRSLSEALAMCPVRIADGKLVALVEQPLSDRWVDELRFAGLGVKQLVVPAHYIDLARAQVYGPPCPERARELERRLARRRKAAAIGHVVAGIQHAPTLAAATVLALDFAECLVSFSCFLVSNGRTVRVGAVSGGNPVPREQFPVPDKSCTFGAALEYEGYFVGPVTGSQADHDFYRSLGRPLPRYAFLAPVPMTDNLSVAFYADNGPRGMSARWIAELTLLVARLGQHAKALAERGRRRPKRPDGSEIDAPDGGVPGRDSVPPTARSAPPALSASEQAAIDRLRQVANARGKTLEALVDELLRDPGGAAPEPTAAALMGEVRGLFAKLANDIPTQLAEGMESAFRDMTPRASSTSSSPPPPSGPPPSGPPPSSVPPTDRGSHLDD